MARTTDQVVAEIYELYANARPTEWAAMLDAIEAGEIDDFNAANMLASDVVDFIEETDQDVSPIATEDLRFEVLQWAYDVCNDARPE